MRIVGEVKTPEETRVYDSWTTLGLCGTELETETVYVRLSVPVRRLGGTRRLKRRTFTCTTILGTSRRTPSLYGVRFTNRIVV